jgi:hypothetical protein
MGKAASLVREDAMVGVLGGILRHGNAERPAMFHALEDEIDTVSVPLFQAAQSEQDMIFFAYSLLGLDGDVMVASVSLHPSPVIVCVLAEDFFVRYRDAEKPASPSVVDTSPDCSARCAGRPCPPFRYARVYQTHRPVG